MILNLLIVLLQDPTTSVLNPLINTGVVGAILIISLYFNWKQWSGHKVEIRQHNEARDKERNDLYNKLDRARLESIKDVKESNKQFFDLAIKFENIVNELRKVYNAKNE